MKVCSEFVPWEKNANVCKNCMNLKCDSTINLDMEREVANLFRKAILKAYPAVKDAMPAMLITPGKASEYQCNNAMGLVKQLSQMPTPIKESPEAVAQAITAALDYSSGLVKEATPTKQGFINISIGVGYVQRAISKLVRSGVSPPAVEKQKILVDFSSPNIAKVMHVGHLRSTIIGDSICRLLEFCGHEVLRVNHVGDWGTQFGMLIAHLKSESPDFMESPPDIKNLVTFYKAAKQRFDEDAEFKAQSHKEVVALQSGNEVNLAAWKMICDISRKEFSTIYDKLNVDLEECGESFYNPIIPKVLKLCEDKGLVELNEGAKIISATDKKELTKLSKTDPERIIAYYMLNPKGKVKINPVLAELATKMGFAKKEGDSLLIQTAASKWVDIAEVKHEDCDKFLKMGAKMLKPLHPELIKELENMKAIEDGKVAIPAFNIPLIVTKSDGGYSYDTTDVAAVWYRTQDLKVDRAIYVTDLGQELHFMMIFRMAQDAGWTQREGKADVRLDHVGFGVVCGPDGKKYKTRSGTTAALADLLEEGCEHSYKISYDRQEEKKARFEELKKKGELRDEYKEFSEAELREIADTVGLGAIKYCDLRQNRTSDYVFNSEKMCSLEGNTVMCMLYAYVRCKSLARKAGIEDLDTIRDSEINLVLESEKKLGICLLRFPAVIERTCDNLLAHNITDYLYQLVQRFNECYNDTENWKVVGDPLQNSRLLLCEATATTLKTGLHLLGIKTVDRI
eukprot:TRINITY_DN5193_c0_g1_i1.p1 TRINITY_DN5193_c0_g1~~TRINITY_DN5193_c0_g1_i1.p1  ORF type:complete len:739 (+),score=359.58 TRINITY_DN5193_c0_g1_i1:67-2283(+)